MGAKIRGPEDESLLRSMIPGYSVLAKSMIGSGMLGLAAACQAFGWALGLAAAIFAGLLTFLSLHLLAMIAIPFQGGTPLSFLKICSSLSPRMRPVVDIAIAAKCLGAAVAYLVCTGDMISNLVLTIMLETYGTQAGVEKSLGLSILSLNRIIQACVVFCLAPFCYCKSITSTKIANLFGLACMLFITVLAIVKSDFDSAAETHMLPTNIFKLFEKLPVFIFAFTCQQNVFGVIDDLQKPSVKTMSVVSATSTFTGIILFLVVMVFPYATYGDAIDSNFLKTMLHNNPNDSMVIVGCVLASVAVSISYPLQALPMRRSLVALIYGSQTLDEAKEVRVRYILASLIVVTTLGLGLLFPTGLGTVMEMTGLIGGNLICFVMPSWLFIQAVKKGVVKSSPKLYSASWGLFIGSLLLYPLCLGSKAYIASS